MHDECRFQDAQACGEQRVEAPRDRTSMSVLDLKHASTRRLMAAHHAPIGPATCRDRSPPPDDVDRYLARIGQPRPDDLTLTSLARPQDAHVRSVPFENFDIHLLGRLLSLRDDDLVRKVVDDRRGGFRFELTGLFSSLLTALGHEVVLARRPPLARRRHARPAIRPRPDPRHRRRAADCSWTSAPAPRTRPCSLDGPWSSRPAGASTA